MTSLIGICLLTLVLSCWSVDLVRRYLNQHLLDIPNERSSHQIPTPRGGGMGFVISAAIGLFLYICVKPSASTVQLLPWLLLLPLVITGALDDWKSLKASTRYLVQMSVAGLMVLQVGPFPQPWLSVLGEPGQLVASLLTVISVTALINFYNFMDGVDGLVAGASLIQFAFCAIAFNQPFLWVLVAALAGFLLWNWAPAKIFMGDAGSTALGATMALTLLQGGNQALATQPGLAWSYIVISLPIVGDAIYTLVRRSLRRENIFQAHRSHIYQRLNHQAGWSHAQIALGYMSITLSIGVGLLLWGHLGAGLGISTIALGFLLAELRISRADSASLAESSLLVKRRSSESRSV